MFCMNLQPCRKAYLLSLHVSDNVALSSWATSARCNLMQPIPIRCENRLTFRANSSNSTSMSTSRVWKYASLDSCPEFIQKQDPSGEEWRAFMQQKTLHGGHYGTSWLKSASTWENVRQMKSLRKGRLLESSKQDQSWNMVKVKMKRFHLLGRPCHTDVGQPKCKINFCLLDLQQPKIHVMTWIASNPKSLSRPWTINDYIKQTANFGKSNTIMKPSHASVTLVI